MPGFILGEKSISSQLFTPEGEKVHVTHILTSPCYVIDIKQKDKHGYFSLVLGFGNAKNIKKPQEGILKKAGIKSPLRFFKEIRLDNPEMVTKDDKTGVKIGETELFIGDEVKSSLLFKAGEIVNVTGTSKGKGFAGVVKRHSFKGGPRTHGQSDRERAPGSIGQTTTPGRVYKGKRMAGRMGSDTITVRKLIVISATDTELIVKGSIPGAKKGNLKIVSK